MAESRVRAATSADEQALSDVDQETWTAQTSPAPVPDWTDPPAFFGPRRSPRDTWVGLLDGRVAGFVGLRQEIEHASHGHVLSIGGLGVLVAAQRRGLGRELLAEAVEQARVRGAGKLTLRVLGTNTAARRLYADCGFEVEGVLRAEFELDGRLVDDVLMARHL